jgi:hypothetical protein
VGKVRKTTGSVAIKDITSGRKRKQRGLSILPDAIKVESMIDGQKHETTT